MEEISSVSGVMFSLKNLLSDDESEEAWAMTSRSLAVANSPLAQFQSALERLSAKLAPARGMSKAGKSLIWPFNKVEVMEILSTIERQKTLFMLALQNDHVYVNAWI